MNDPPRQGRNPCLAQSGYIPRQVASNGMAHCACESRSHSPRVAFTQLLQRSISPCTPSPKADP